jgi:molybdate transport system substrate-binding protein
MIAAALALLVLSAGAASEFVRDVAASFTRAPGTAVAIETGTAGQLRSRILGGARADVVIVPAGGIDELERSGTLVAGTRADLGRTGTGVGVRAGASAVDLSSPESFKAALLGARAVASTDPTAGASFGIAFAGMLERLGIADQMKPKLRLTPGGRSCELVVRGECDFCVQSIAEIVPVAGISFVGPLPAALQYYVVYTAAVPRAATDAAAGRSFIAYLTAPTEGAARRAAGFEAP